MGIAKVPEEEEEKNKEEIAEAPAEVAAETPAEKLQEKEIIPEEGVQKPNEDTEGEKTKDDDNKTLSSENKDEAKKQQKSPSRQLPSPNLGGQTHRRADDLNPLTVPEIHSKTTSPLLIEPSPPERPLPIESGEE